MTAAQLLSDLIRVDTSNPPGNEEPAAEVLRAHLDAAGLPTEMLVSPQGRSARRVSLIARVPRPPDRPALLLVSHTDVVGVERGRWAGDPFSGATAGGAIWGRGALDMKGVAVMHAEAAIALSRCPTAPSREVIVAAVADEEALGGEGMQWLLRDAPGRLGFGSRPAPEALGEGGYGLSGVFARPVMPIVVGEKTAVTAEAVARGAAGHASLPRPIRRCATWPRSWSVRPVRIVHGCTR